MGTDSSCNKLPASFSFLNATQFLGAMNDNILKLLIVYCLIGVRGSDQAGFVTAAAGAAFALPFLLFSAPAGCIADRFRKFRTDIRREGCRGVRNGFGRYMLFV
jgi:acyl-[acyl-carrier-protein]-phospholipid O-acyltransferase/long-chain-fatty-acid--[acyl-carrier-protein] ligase